MVGTGIICTVRLAEDADLSGIMQVERNSFTAGIVESETVFAERLSGAKGCNHVLVHAGTAAVYGYFTSEIWRNDGVEGEAFALGHPVHERHCPDGTVLYISSFALLPVLRGKKITLSGGNRTSSAGADPAGVAQQTGTTQPAGAASTFFKTAIHNTLKGFPQLERIILLVHEDWYKAIRIYEAQGFTRTNVLKHFAGFGNKRAFIYEKTV
ncbi:MAG: GNAT family N-acetyltransferase [Treponema sp.]